MSQTLDWWRAPVPRRRARLALSALRCAAATPPQRAPPAAPARTATALPPSAPTHLRSVLVDSELPVPTLPLQPRLGLADAVETGTQRARQQSNGTIFFFRPFCARKSLLGD